MKKLMFLFVSFLVVSNLHAKEPGWVKLNYRNLQYPQSNFYSSFVENAYEKKENPKNLLDELKERASMELSSSIKVRVEAMSTNMIEEDNQEHNSYYKWIATSYTNIELVGLNYKTHIDPKSRRIYALSYVKKQTLNDYYENQLRQVTSDLIQKIEKAEHFLQQSNQSEAQKVFRDAQVLARKYESYQSVLAVTDPLTFRNKNIEKGIQLQKRLNNISMAIKSSEHRSINDLGHFMVQELSHDFPPKCRLKIAYITYGDTKFTSPFSKRFSYSLVEALVQADSIEIVEEMAEGTWLVRGTYWEEGDNLLVSLFVTDSEGSIIGAASDLISKDYLTRSEISYQAENFSEAYTRLQDFRKNELVESDQIVELWTNKGTDNLLFQEGEILRLFVRVNTPSYLRCIYYLAGGEKVLLLDNYYIDESKVNKVIEIPDKFECAEPFGYETLYVTARTRSFEPLKTRERDGYDFVLSSPLAIVQNARGFKKVSNGDKISEVRLDITTYK